MEEDTIIEIAKLIPSRRTKIVPLKGKGNVKIQNLFFGEIAEVWNAADKDPFKQALGLLVRGVVSPKITWDQAKKMDPDDVAALIREIVNQSGFSAEEIENAKKGLGED